MAQSNVIDLEPRRVARIEWTPAMIRTAESQAESGRLRMAAELCEQLMADDRVTGVLQVLTGVVSLPLTFESSTGEDDDPVVEALESDWWHMLPEQSQCQAVSWLRLLGVCLICVREWSENEHGRVAPSKVEVWTPKSIEWDWTNRSWRIRRESGQAVPIDPGDGNWVVCVWGDGNAPWMRMPWRSMARWWMLKRYAQTDWGRYSGRQGQGLPVATATEGASEEHRLQLVQDLQDLGPQSAIVLPEGYTLEMLESKAKTHESFEKQTNCANTAMSIALIGNNLSTEVQGGSFAAAKVHQSVTHQVIRLLAATWSTCIREQLLSWWAEYNFGDRALAPWPKWDTSEPQDGKARSEAISAFFDALGKARKEGFEIENIEEMAGELGIQLRRVEEPAEDDGTGEVETDDEPPNDEERAARATADPLVEMQLHGDRVVDATASLAAAELRSHIDKLISIVGKAETFEEIRTGILSAYEGMSPDTLDMLTERGVMLAQLGGALSVDREV